MFNLDQIVGTHAQAVMWRARRAEVLASNLANAETPHYQARDLDFSSMLQDEMGGAQLVRTQTKHLALGDSANFGSELMYRVPAQASLDQNTVDVQVERAAFLDNALRYQASLRFLGSQFAGLTRAFRGE